MLEDRGHCLPEPHEQGTRGVSFPRTFKPESSPSSSTRLRLGLVDVPLDIFLCIARFLDVQDVLVLRRVSSVSHLYSTMETLIRLAGLQSVGSSNTITSRLDSCSQPTNNTKRASLAFLGLAVNPHFGFYNGRVVGSCRSARPVVGPRQSFGRAQPLRMSLEARKLHNMAEHLPLEMVDSPAQRASYRALGSTEPLRQNPKDCIRRY